MIPLRLTLKNFVCYRDNVPPLDLEGLHVACLCGDNGHGKTALLDAITWALWGQARARTQDDLIHQGQQDMAVELDFMALGQRYRVSRRHSRSTRGRQGATILELQVVSDGRVQPITGNSVRETQRRIREILRMDYDTFINTAFLRQGDADRFTTSRPTERKQTLAEVLDLSYYQALEERAKSHSRDIQDRVRDVETAIALRQRDIDNRPQYEKELASVKADLEGIVPEAQAQRLKVEELRRAVDSLQRRRPELEELARSIANYRQDVARLRRQVQSHESRVREYESALRKESEIRKGFARLAESRAELERLNQALARKSELDREKTPLETKIAVQRERLSGQADRLRKTIAEDLEPKARRLPEIEEELRSVAREQEELAAVAETIRQTRSEAEELDGRVRFLRQANENLLKEMEDSRKKFDMLEQGDSLCPLCNQPLGPEGKEHLRREYEEQGLERKRQYQANDAQQKELGRKHKELTTLASRLEKDLDSRRRQAERKAATLQRDLKESQAAQAGLQPAVAQLEQLERTVRTEDFALDERRRIAELDARLSELGYDAERHSQAREQVKALEGYDELHRKLQEASANLPAERDALETARQMLGRRQQEIQEAEGRKTALEQELEALPSLESQLRGAETRYQELERQRDAALVKQGVLEQQIRTCEELEAKVRQQQQERHRLLDEQGIYDELARAFGKNGIQALIIESAIPELQADANELLGRLTENRMFLKLELKEGRLDSRTGLRAEELNIQISDEVGTRPYETFSGGEAFRINFALRIALSKLLARRSGAPLPILFIDEGFGSQDTAGQERLTEAIQSIKDDFEKIIVITHIEQMKEKFEERIEVTKTAAGSTFQVV